MMLRAEAATTYAARPTWLALAVAFCLCALELALFYSDRFSFGTISWRYLFTALLLPTTLIFMLRHAGRSAALWRMTWAWATFLFVCLLVNYGTGAPQLPYLAANVVQPFAALLVLAVLFRRSPLTPILLVLAFTSLSNLIGVLQALDIDWAWDLRRMVSLSMVDGIRHGGRVNGLSEQPVRFSYLVLLSTAIASGLYVHFRKRRVLLLVLLALGLFALVASGTRSAVVAFAAMLLATLYLGYPRARRSMIGWALVAVPLVIVLPPLLSEVVDTRLLLTGDVSASFRPLLWSVALDVVWHWPFGIGSFNFANKVDPTAFEYLAPNDPEALSGLGVFEPHNYLIDATVYYGIIGLAVLVWFIALMVWLARPLIENADPKIASIWTISITALVATLANSVVHNGGPLMGESGMMLIWASLGAALIYRATTPAHLAALRLT